MGLAGQVSYECKAHCSIRGAALGCMPHIRARLQSQIAVWLQLESCELSSAVLHMVVCLEDLADVLLQDLAVKQTYGLPGSHYIDAHVAQYYTGSSAGSPQLSI